MQVNLDLKKILGSIGIAALLGIFLYLFISFQLDYRKNVQIISWSPNENSSYVCFAAVKGNNILLALDCIDTSLTVTTSSGG